MALTWRVCETLRERNWRTAICAGVLAALFLAYLAFIVRSRAAIGVTPFLGVLLGWRQFRWKGLMIACIAGVVVAAGLWATSPNLREFFVISIQQAEAYGIFAADNSIGEHIEFLSVRPESS